MQPIKVLIVDDSALVRRILTDVLSAQPDITVVGAAADPYMARDQIKALNPDVLTLDVEMPRMDGLEFLRRLMQLRPMPVVMVSSLTEAGSETALQALELGAIDVVGKPRAGVASSLAEYGDEIASKIRIAARARVQALRSHLPANGQIANPGKLVGIQKARPMRNGSPAVHPTAAEVPERLSADAILPIDHHRKLRTTERIVVLGASTGGTEAIRVVLDALPADAPALLIAQHMPAAFTASFARRLDTSARMVVKEAQDGERALPGHAYVAPGYAHLMLDRSGANYILRLNEGPAVNRHRPSVDVLFRSAANTAGANAVGVILTGMGSDGAEGLKELRECGAHTIAQNEESCVVFGMPREAIARGAASEILPLDRIASAIVQAVQLRDRAIRV